MQTPSDEFKRIRAAEPEFARFIDRWKPEGKVTWIYTRERTWGSPLEDRVRAAGGIGVAVQASAQPKVKRA